MLGTLAAIATTGTELVSLFLDLHRGEFPWFADSVIIPLISLPIALLLLLGWMGVHLGLRRWVWRSVYGTRRDLFRFWLQAMGAMMGLLLLRSLQTGDFLFLLPCLLWLAFYFTLWRSLTISCAWSALGSKTAGWPR